MQTPNSLARVLKGWDGYNTSIVRAVQGLNSDQLAFRLKPDMRSVAEIARHIAIGRLCWFIRMDAPGSAELAASLVEWNTDDEGNRHPVEEQVPLDKDEIVKWLNDSWGMVQATLDAWSSEDLYVTYLHPFRGVNYALTRQWTLFRILAHDMHHGGQLSLLLDMQGADAPDLIYFGGHITDPDVAE